MYDSGVTNLLFASTMNMSHGSGVINLLFATTMNMSHGPGALSLLFATTMNISVWFGCYKSSIHSSDEYICTVQVS